MNSAPPQTIRLQYDKALALLLEAFKIRGAVASGTAETALEETSRMRLRPATKWFICGISGSGKSTITGVLAGAGYSKLPGITTRPQRPTETSSDYVFTDDVTFKQWEAAGLIFQPHITNQVWHGTRYIDLHRLEDDERMYADKSVGSLIKIVTDLPVLLERASFVYLLAPSIDELWARITRREAGNGAMALSEAEIIDRFEEEIEQMARSIELPCAYVVNDDAERVKTLIRRLLQ